jgi:hypothetical protein
MRGWQDVLAALALPFTVVILLLVLILTFGEW